MKRRAKGETPAEAYKVTHGNGRNSSKLEAKPQVRHALGAVETQVLKGSLMTISQRRDYVLDRLKTECETGKDATRVRALELLGRTAGLWNEAREEPVGGADAIKQRIEELLASVRGRTIEHAVDVGRELVPLEGESAALGAGEPEDLNGAADAEDGNPEPHPSPTNPIERSA